MLDFYYLATPQGQQLLTFLEESGLPYQRLPQRATLALAGQWLSAQREMSTLGSGTKVDILASRKMSTCVPDPRGDISLDRVLP